MRRRATGISWARFGCTCLFYSGWNFKRTQSGGTVSQADSTVGGWVTGLFGASFFSITGLHLSHVTGGVIALVVVGLRYRGGRYNADDIEVLGLYWHFVDLVWMFVVPLVYLLNLAH